MARSGSNLTQEVARKIVGMLISQEYDLRDLRQIARRFQIGEFDHLIYVLIEDVCFNLNPKVYRSDPEPEMYSPPKPPKKTSSTGQSASERMLGAIRKKKMSRQRFARKVEDALELPVNALARSDPSMEVLVARLLNDGTPSQIGRVEADLGLGDAYLSGITNNL